MVLSRIPTRVLHKLDLPSCKAAHDAIFHMWFLFTFGAWTLDHALLVSVIKVRTSSHHTVMFWLSVPSYTYVPFYLSGNPFNAQSLINNAVSNIICCLVFGERFEYDDKQHQYILQTFNELVYLEGGIWAHVRLTQTHSSFVLSGITQQPHRINQLYVFKTDLEDGSRTTELTWHCIFIMNSDSKMLMEDVLGYFTEVKVSIQPCNKILHNTNKSCIKPK